MPNDDYEIDRNRRVIADVRRFPVDDRDGDADAQKPKAPWSAAAGRFLNGADLSNYCRREIKSIVRKLTAGVLSRGTFLLQVKTAARAERRRDRFRPRRMLEVHGTFFARNCHGEIICHGVYCELATVGAKHNIVGEKLCTYSSPTPSRNRRQYGHRHFNLSDIRVFN